MHASRKVVLDLNIGSTIFQDGREYVITHQHDLDRLICRDVESGRPAVFDIGKIGSQQAVASAEPIRGRVNSQEIQTLSQEQWDIAKRRRAVVEQLLSSKEKHGQARYRQLASNEGVSVATLYRWLQAYVVSGYLLSSLVSTKKLGGAGKGRVDAACETIIADYLRTDWLRLQKKSVAIAVRDIRGRCEAARVPLPAANTIRLRISWLDQREKVSKRHGEKKAREQFDPIKGAAPDADWVLQRVEIDHTLLPIVLVDDRSGKSIRRVWITLAIDAFSRVCLGMHLSMDAPSGHSVGQCLTHAMLLKDKWLKSLQAPDNVQWNFWGTPEVLVADNAREFRGNLIRKSC